MIAAPPPGPPKPRAATVAAKLAAAIAVALIVVVGMWVSGGLITNDFTLAMWLTAGWMALAGVAALGAGLRWRRLAVPVIGTYLVVAAVAGVYLGRSTLFDDVVDEDVVTAAAPPRDTERVAGGRVAERGRPRNVLIAGGRFQPLAHSAAGVASAIRLARGGRVLTLTSFEIDNGPDLRVYLVAGPARSESEVDDFEDLGGLKGSKGDQQYELPAAVDLDRYSTVVIWCRAFSVAFARAPLRRA